MGKIVGDFPRTLSLLRKEKKISQRKAAEDLGVSQALLSHYEKGAREPGLSFVVRVADYYDVSVDYLLGRTMARNGAAIAAESIPDMSVEKGNVLKGNVKATLTKKLLINSISLIFDVLGKCENKQLVSDVSGYFAFPVYKAFRMLYTAGYKGTAQEFPTPVTMYSALCDSGSKTAEAGIMQAVSDKGVAAGMPDMSLKTLQREYPMLSPSLLSILQSVSEKLEKE